MSKLGFKHSEETVLKMKKHAQERFAVPENNPMFGKKHSKETRQKISLSHIGKKLPPFTEEHKTKIGLANKGKKRTKEYCQKMSEDRKGKNLGCESNNWKGGKVKFPAGYIGIFSPNHPFRRKNKYVFEHRFVVEKHLKRFLEPKEVVHHINHVKHDNRIDNLMVFKNQPYHAWFHRKGFCNPDGIIFDGRLL